MRTSAILSPLLAAGLLAAPAAPAAAFKGAKLAHLAKVKLAEARRIALAARHGAVKDEELEREKGGTGLRYSFDIASGGKVFEVGVDARTGRILENGAEAKAD